MRDLDETTHNTTDNTTDNTVDLQRRRALKMAGALTAGGAIAATPAAALACTAGQSKTQQQASHTADKPLNEFTVEVQHHWQSNDIALVIRNRGNHEATITHITPSTIELARGNIDVNAILERGPVTLAAGEQIAVPLRHHKRNLYNSQAILGGGHFDRSLQKQLRERISIITDHDSLAAVTVAPGPRIA
jgi:hypothetical protein